MMRRIRITCLCGKVSPTVQVGDAAPQQIGLCHCFVCRHATGQLYSSYYAMPDGNDMAGVISDSALASFDLGTAHEAALQDEEASTPAVIHRGCRVYFCATCGCHVLRTSTATDRDAARLEVATGTITLLDVEDGDGGISLPAATFGPHSHVESTLDGGVARFMGHMPVNPQPVPARIAVYGSSPEKGAAGEDAIAASCLCAGVQFRITAPSAGSRTPTSGYSDMIIPFHSQDPRIRNPDDEKWWLRRGGTRYMAGLCACRSCRLTSGFELQSWAFVPRINIEHRTSTVIEGEDSWEMLDFETVRATGTLRSYESSPGVLREFCGRCGATAFWHDKWRPELIDVSVGLLKSSSGARAESMLEWWMTRVSFAEEAVSGRTGEVRELARELVESVEENMKALHTGERGKVMPGR